MEFALVATLFFTIVLGVFELTRAIYLVNTLQEVTRRAAAMAANAPFDQSAREAIQSKALFKAADGNLLLGAPITPAHVKIDYLSLTQAAGTTALTLQPMATLPECPARNRLNCLADPHGASCARLVRVRICVPGGEDCTSVPYKAVFNAVELAALHLPRAETITPVQTAGNSFGAMPCSN